MHLWRIVFAATLAATLRQPTGALAWEVGQDLPEEVKLPIPIVSGTPDPMLYLQAQIEQCNSLTIQACPHACSLTLLKSRVRLLSEGQPNFDCNRCSLRSILSPNTNVRGSKHNKTKPEWVKERVASVENRGGILVLNELQGAQPLEPGVHSTGDLPTNAYRV
jgi:hypothetical protein